MSKVKLSSTFYKRVNNRTVALCTLNTEEFEYQNISDNDDNFNFQEDTSSLGEVCLDAGQTDSVCATTSFCVDELQQPSTGQQGSKVKSSEFSASAPASSNNFKHDLQSWALRNAITHSALGELLVLLKKSIPNVELPCDARTLLSTPRNTIVSKVDPGFYSHVGIQVAVQKLCNGSDVAINKIDLLCNVDGLPLSKSSGSQIYPILCTLQNHKNNKVSVIGVYHGYEKPSDANAFLKQFVDEAIDLTNNGILINSQVIPFAIKGFICDVPAKAFICYTKGHTGFFSCTKCVQKGTYLKGRTCFPKTTCRKRTDQSFLQQSQPQHHTGTSILQQIPGFGMVSQVPLEYMHLICLGIVKKLIVNLWLFGKAPNKLSPQIAKNISILHSSFKDHVPTEFARKPRSLEEIKHWKATEFRFFLLYSGPVVLKQFLAEDKFANFLCLHVATTIFANPEHTKKYCDFAESLCTFFVQNFGEIYGQEYISHNVHALIHVSDDVKTFGCLDSYSAFCFENYLQMLKKMVRKSENPLPQIMRRLSELENLPECSNSRPATVLPDREHEKGPLPQGFSTQYERLQFQNFILDVNKKGNNFCSLRDGAVIQILNFVKRDNILYAFGKKFMNKESFFLLPCDSAKLGIFLVNGVGPSTTWPVTDIVHKLVTFRYEDQLVFYNMVQYSVVHFIEEDTVEAVPLSWIEDNLCCWPPFAGLKLKTAISKGMLPESSWKKLRIRVIGKTYDSLSTARLKALKAETVSDLNSETEVKRKRVKKRHFTLDDADEDDDNSKESEEEEEESEDDYHKRSKMPRMEETPVMSLEENNAAQFVTVVQGDTTPAAVQRNTPAQDLTPVRNNGTPSLSADEIFKRQVLRQFSILSYKLDQIQEDLAGIKRSNRSEEPEPEEQIMNKFRFPIKTQDELNEIESFLGNKEAFHQFVKELAKIGGSCPKIMVRRTMSTVLTNDLANKYSWIGFKSKSNFSVLAIAQVIRDAVSRVHPNRTLAEIEAAMKMWLVKSKERHDKELK